jgi:hypothetical protein
MAADMPKLLLFMLILVAAGIATGAALAWYENHPIAGSDSLTNVQKNDAGNIALSDHLTKTILDNPNSTYRRGSIDCPGPDFYVRSNTSRTLAVVPLMLTNDFGMTNVTYTVDLDTKKVVSRYFEECSPNITYEQQMDAIRVALNDTDVQAWMKDLATGDSGVGTSLYSDGYNVGYVRQSDFTEYGYVDPFGFYVDVPLTISSPLPQAVKYLTVTVNLGDNTTAIIKESCGEALMGSIVTATIPPGQSFYRQYYFPIHGMTLSDHMLTDDSNYIRIDQQPEDVCLYPNLVDHKNLDQIKNGTAFTDVAGARFNVRGSQWFVYVPGCIETYLVLKNQDASRPVTVTMPFRPA